MIRRTFLKALCASPLVGLVPTEAKEQTYPCLQFKPGELPRVEKPLKRIPIKFSAGVLSPELQSQLDLYEYKRDVEGIDFFKR